MSSCLGGARSEQEAHTDTSTAAAAPGLLTCKQLAGLQVTPMAGAQQQLQLTGSGFGQDMRDVRVSVAMQVRAM